MCQELDVGSRMEPPNDRAPPISDGLSQLKPGCGQGNKIGTDSDFKQSQQFQLFRRGPAPDRPVVTDQWRQTNAEISIVGDQIGQQNPQQKLPQEQPKQQLKLKWSKEKRDAVISRTRRGIEKPAENWGTNDELEVLAKMFGIRFVLSETAQAAELQRITIGEDGSPTIFLINTDNRHFDVLIPHVDGNYSRLPQHADGNCMYHSVIRSIFDVSSKLHILENEWHIFTPNFMRGGIIRWIADDINFQSEATDGVDQISINTREQLQARNGMEVKIQQLSYENTAIRDLEQKLKIQQLSRMRTQRYVI